MRFLKLLWVLFRQINNLQDKDLDVDGFIVGKLVLTVGNLKNAEGSFGGL